jgi:hypothetical protein
MTFPDISDCYFVCLFGIPEKHELTRVRFEEPQMDTYQWQHEELDPRGEIVSIYTTRLWFGMATGASFTRTRPDGSQLEYRSVPDLVNYCSRKSDSSS